MFRNVACSCCCGQLTSNSLVDALAAGCARGCACALHAHGQQQRRCARAAERRRSAANPAAGGAAGRVAGAAVPGAGIKSSPSTAPPGCLTCTVEVQMCCFGFVVTAVLPGTGIEAVLAQHRQVCWLVEAGLQRRCIAGRSASVSMLVSNNIVPAPTAAATSRGT